MQVQVISSLQNSRGQQLNIRPNRDKSLQKIPKGPHKMPTERGKGVNPVEGMSESQQHPPIIPNLGVSCQDGSWTTCYPSQARPRHELTWVHKNTQKLEDKLPRWRYEPDLNLSVSCTTDKSGYRLGGFEGQKTTRLSGPKSAKNQPPCKQAANTKSTGISWAGLANSLTVLILAKQDFLWKSRRTK